MPVFDTPHTETVEAKASVSLNAAAKVPARPTKTNPGKTDGPEKKQRKKTAKPKSSASPAARSATKLAGRKPSSANPPESAKTPEIKPVLDTSFKNSRAVELRGFVPLNAVTTAQILRGLQLQYQANIWEGILAEDAAKTQESPTKSRGKTSKPTVKLNPLRLILGPADCNKYRHQDQAALADTLMLVGQPVDVVIRSAVGAEMLRTVLSATGNRFMAGGASLYMGPHTGTFPYGKNKESQVRRQLFNDYKIDLQTLVMLRTGVADREQVYRDLLSARERNAMEALYYGEKGLIDGILMGPNQVITRPMLDRFLRNKRWKPLEIDQFLKNYINVYQLPTEPLEKHFPESCPEGRLNHYKPLYTPPKKEKKSEDASTDKPEEKKPENDTDSKPQAPESVAFTALEPASPDAWYYAPSNHAAGSSDKKNTQKGKARTQASESSTATDPSKVDSENNTEKTAPLFYAGEKKIDPVPAVLRASKDRSPSRMAIHELSDNNAALHLHGLNTFGILEDDTIFFNDGFKDETAQQISDALIALDHKRADIHLNHSELPISHIKILENSPGGSVWSGQELRSLIRSLNYPVDVIVYGMGASCGSWLLCSATGNRFATPQSRIMFHEAATSLPSQTPHDHYNEIQDSLNQSTLDYIAIVADACDRPFEAVLKDFDHDVWLNPVEALFYGNKGMIDAILVNHAQIITRNDVEAYLLKQFKTRKAVGAYVEKKILEKRDPRTNMAWKPQEHNENDPFDNPLVVIEAVAKSSAQFLKDVKAFQGSVPKESYAHRSVDYFNVVIKED